MGAISALMRELVHLSHEFLFEPAGEGRLFGETPGGAFLKGALQVSLPAIGGLVVGFFIYRLLHLSGGHGVANVMKAIATGNVKLAPSMAIKSGSSVITITSGGSCGQEGPIIEIGSVVGSLFGQRMKVSREKTGTLIGCGAAAGIAGVFNAPIGGVFLALELLMRDFAVRSFGPVAVAAVVGSVTSQLLLPGQPIFAAISTDMLTSISNTSYTQVVMFSVLGLMCGLGGALLVYALFKAHDIFQTLNIPLWLKPAFGGLAVGVVGLAFPDILGEGYDFVKNQILHTSDPQYVLSLSWKLAGFFLFIALLKIFATSMTLGSGGTGGSLAPAMVVGAMLGAGVGVVCNIISPEASPDISVFSMVGMAGTVTSSLHIRIAGMLIVYEVAGAHYQLMLPLMITVAVSSMTSLFLKQGSVYTLSLLRDGFDVDEAIQRARDPLVQMKVKDIMQSEFTKLSPHADLAEVLETFSLSEDDAFVVVGEEEEMLGLISTKDLRGVLHLREVGVAIIAADAMDPNPSTLSPDSPVSDALEIFNTTDSLGIPVVSSKGGKRRSVGMVSRISVLNAMGIRETSSSIELQRG